MTLSQFFASTNHFGGFERPVSAADKVVYGCEGIANYPDTEFEGNEEPRPCAGVWICLFDNMETTIIATGGAHAQKMADEMNLAMIQARGGEQEEEEEVDSSESVAGSTGASSSASKSSWETAKMLSASIKGSIKSRGSKLAKACKSVVRKMTKRVVSSKTANAATTPVAA